MSVLVGKAAVDSTSMAIFSNFKCDQESFDMKKDVLVKRKAILLVDMHELLANRRTQDVTAENPRQSSPLSRPPRSF